LDSAKDAPLVAIINQTMAHRSWPEEDPINKRFKLLDPNFKSAWFTVVGVVGDVREEGLETTTAPMAYVPSAVSFYDDLILRATGDPDRLMDAVRKEVRAFDKNALIGHMGSAKSQLVERESHREFSAWLLGSFAFAALVLAAVGIYGVLACWVGQRTQEIGVRMALGAKKSDALRLVMGQGLNFAIVGILLGGGAACGLARYVASSLYGVQPIDPLTLVAVSAILLGVALLASYIPARRATQVDPMVALRYE
jgi:putative ABC transport system permease protein